MQGEIGLALRLGRVGVGLSQWRLAARVGVHPSILNLIEQGKRSPTAELVESVLHELDANVPESDLVTLVLREARRIAARSNGG